MFRSEQRANTGRLRRITTSTENLGANPPNREDIILPFDLKRSQSDRSSKTPHKPRRVTHSYSKSLPDYSSRMSHGSTSLPSNSFTSHGFQPPRLSNFTHYSPIGDYLSPLTHMSQSLPQSPNSYASPSSHPVHSSYYTANYNYPHWALSTSKSSVYQNPSATVSSASNFSNPGETLSVPSHRVRSQGTPCDSYYVDPISTPHTFNSNYSRPVYYPSKRPHPFNQVQLPQHNAYQDTYPISSQQMNPSEGPVVSRDNISNSTSKKPAFIYIFLEKLLRQVCLSPFLGLPALYLSRMEKVFKDADISISEIEAMALEIPTLTDKNQNSRSPPSLAFELPTLPVRYENLKYNWESFIDSLMREWKSFNIISVLLLSSVLAMLQIQSAANNLLVRFSALSSSICALTSLLYGCLYVIKFSSMRRMHKGLEWAFEMRNGEISSFWNLWVLLAMPLIWLAWSILLYIICIFSFVWQIGVVADNQPAPTIRPRDIIGPRVALSTIFGLGILYFIFILVTFRRYDDAMDEAWITRVKNWQLERAAAQVGQAVETYQPRGYPSGPPIFPYLHYQGSADIMDPPQWSSAKVIQVEPPQQRRSRSLGV